MAEMDTRESGPMTMQEALDQFATRYAETETEQEEAPQEAEDAKTDEVEAEAEEADESEADEPETDEDGPQVLNVDEYGDVLVDVNGTEQPLSELVKGTLRQEDYTRKTQQLAEERKRQEAEIKQREEELSQREQQLQAQLAEMDEQEPDWEKLAEEDPLGWPVEKAKWEKKQREKQKRREELEQRQQKQMHDFKVKTAQMAVEKFPEWREEGGYDKNADARKKQAIAAGFTEDEYNATPDFRFAVLLEKAARYDAMQSDQTSKRAAAEKKVAKAPKVLKPGQSQGPSDPEQERKAARQKRLSKPVSSDEIKNWLGR